MLLKEISDEQDQVYKQIKTVKIAVLSISIVVGIYIPKETF
jgi:hypothetical protein